ncbi:MAG: hypothetical protein K6U11_09565 [bacterium]|nr:hypothetical protein [bacterium]
MRIATDNKVSDVNSFARYNDSKSHVLQSINKEISNKIESRFTGKLIFVLNLSQGGIGQCSIQTDTRLN